MELFAMTSLFDATREQLNTFLADQPRYRVDQVWKGLYEQFKAPREMTTLPAAVRSELEATFPSALEVHTHLRSSDGDTNKMLSTLADGNAIETVLMRYPDRATVCVSTQAGCAMACGFCATGQGGFERHLTSGEIVEQVILAARAAAPRRVSNVVFMGMGEPLANYAATLAAVTVLHDEVGLGARRLTISTVGIVPGIVKLAAEPLPVNLAVSLHAANDTLRDELVPINRRYPLAQLASACQTYLDAKNRRLTFEWAMIDGVNDSSRDAEELAAFVRPLRAHVNLIPLNPTEGFPTVGTPPDGVRRFAAALERLGVNVTIRANRGNDIDAACGQLRARHTVSQPVSLRSAPTRGQVLPD
jgi:23S rRNA (adenine2503-C2)-methyltransferase